MQSLTQEQILAAFRGATKSELDRVSFPLDFDRVDFERREFYAWRDRKAPRRAYLVVPHDDGPVALILNRSMAKSPRRVMCAWCRDVDVDEDAVLYTARRVGARGRRGDSVGVLVCESFGCNRNVRKLPPAYHKGTDLDAIRESQIAELRRRVGAFVAEVVSEAD
ncbi:FBP domain-containing protein [Gordonia sp. PP30]|uniref:FBP domain-containing protein n=1 Tax=unclassified Gordonia (in: high G+C Gram-positive bacteria) TaxID=2657482 RepID=UPI001FFFB62C|nr:MULTISPECIES: FBP domain-containing protein [unclassified Gordonia (in: high G+C Gram-positive bacteria)]UQE75653.1 FBP domain-containing protein [Gordonia sp. PP30]